MQKIEISARTIIFTVFFIIAIQFVWMIRELIFSLLIAFILMSALKPIVKKIETRRIPHSVAVLLVYTLFLLFFGLLLSIIIPPIVQETGHLVKIFPAMVEDVSDRFGSWIQAGTVSQYLPNVTNNIFKVASGIFSNIIFIISTLVFGFYFLLEENAMKRFILPYLSESSGARVVAILDRAEMRMSQWFWGELILMTAVGLCTGIGLYIIGIPYVLPLAVLAGLLEVVPTIGPIIASVPAFLVGFSQSTLMGFSSVAVAVIVQQLENNLLVPVVMKRAVGINPMVTLIALIIGGKIGGVLGILLAVPTFLFLESIIFEFVNTPVSESAVKKR